MVKITNILYIILAVVAIAAAGYDIYLKRSGIPIQEEEVEEPIAAEPVQDTLSFDEEMAIVDSVYNSLKGLKFDHIDSIHGDGMYFDNGHFQRRLLVAVRHKNGMPKLTIEMEGRPYSVRKWFYMFDESGNLVATSIGNNREWYCEKVVGHFTFILDNPYKCLNIKPSSK